MIQKPFVMGLTAIKKTTRRTEFASNCGIVFAVNRYEATGKALDMALDNWPKDDGYTGHEAQILEIPNYTLEKIANYARGAT